jgi:hypothetical protein
MSIIARYTGLVLAALLAAGCGGQGATSDPGPPTPHGGELISLPGGKGFVEVVKKAGSTSKAPSIAEVSFYFHKTMTTPYSPAPTSGSLTIGKKTISLQSSGDALVTPSAAAPLMKGDLDGVLSVELDGKPTAIPLGVR